MIVRHNTVKPTTFDGLQIRDYTADHELSSSLAVIDVPPGGHHKMAYSTRSDKFYFVASGKLSFTLDDTEHQLEEGDLCIVNKGQRFAYRNEGPDPAALILMHTPSFDLNSEIFL